MEHPPKQGLKRDNEINLLVSDGGFNGTSTKTRIETLLNKILPFLSVHVLMEHPPKQGLKLYLLLRTKSTLQGF